MRKSVRIVAAVAGLSGLGLGTALPAHGQMTKTVGQTRAPGSPLAPTGPGAPTPTPAPARGEIPPRWKESFDAFEAADRSRAPVPGGVLFVGSSSIRLWDGLEQAFDDPVAITRRGFGGSRLEDCAELTQRLVLPYRPRLVVVYAGDNDLAEGRSPQQVLQSFTRLVQDIHATLPDTRIAYLSIKPSPSRATLVERARETNALIEAYARDTPNLDYIDIYSRMLDADGRPRAELFLPDALHLNAEGYALWRTVIAPHLRPPSLQAGGGPVVQPVAGPAAAR